MEKVVVIGRHCVLRDLERQYAGRDCEIIKVGDADAVVPTDCSELVLAAGEGGDAEAVACLERLARQRGWQGRPRVHLLLRDGASLWALQVADLPAEVNEAFDVCPFTMQDVWAKNVLVHLPGISDSGYPRLDREPIGAHSPQTVHLLISGFDSQAQAVALNTALVAHFPNYRCDDEVPLRTRITIVDSDIAVRRDDFIAMHQHLFDNSFYRTVDIKNRRTVLHRPMYCGRRKDFVDVEWEFVDGSVSDATVRRKLALWVESQSQQLTIVVSGGSDEKCLSQCVSLPAEVYARHIPVFVRQSRLGLADGLRRSAVYNNVYPFGMHDCGYDVSLPLVRMAKLLNYFYDCSYNDKKSVPTVLPHDEVEAAWRGVQSYRLRLSNICNVMTISSKLHSLGHDTADVEKFYALTADEIRSLSETEHNRWSVERLIMGSRPCTDEEKTLIRRNIAEILKAREAGDVPPEDLKSKYKEQDVHFDLCAYAELETDPTGKNAKVYDYDLTACIPLIAKTFYDESDGKEQ